MPDLSANHLYQASVKVRRGPDCPMPAQLIGAFITCYTAATTHQDALQIAVEKLTANGYIFEDLVDGQIQEIDSSRWDEHVVATWPEFPNYFPHQADMVRFIQAGGVFFAPVCGWESEG